MADLHSTPDTDETGTERSLIVGYRPTGSRQIHTQYYSFRQMAARCWV